MQTEQRILAELCPPLRTEVLMFLNARIVASIDFFRGQVAAPPPPTRPRPHARAAGRAGGRVDESERGGPTAETQTQASEED